MTMVRTAEKLARRMHKGQTRQFGDPCAFINHPKAVAELVNGRDAKTVAWLHDIVEDTPMTLTELRLIGFPDRIVEAVDILTLREGETHKELVKRAKGNKIAEQVRRADILHNISTMPKGHSLARRWAEHLELLK